MSKINSLVNPDESSQIMMKSRRKLLSILGGGVLVGSNSIPTRWTKPIIDELMLPAHGMTSPMLPTLSTTAITNLMDTSAESGGTITSNGGASITTRGVVWSTSMNPTLADTSSSDGSGIGAFSSNVTGLSELTTYYVRAYATNSFGTAYGENVELTTIMTPMLATVSTTAISTILETSAESGGTITSNGGASITSRGVVWSTSLNPTLADTSSSDGSGIGAFSSSLTGLTGLTTYYVRAYATNSVGTAYGDNINFMSIANLPILTTTTVTNIGFTDADSGGNISSDGGAAVTNRGVVWNTSMNPTITDSLTSDGSGIGFFSSNLTPLTPGGIYYVRAYATNSVGTAYGNQLDFGTPVCLIKGTKCLLANGQLKNIEDITYDDQLQVWNFDDGKFDVSHPLWIKVPQTTDRYNLLKFSDGSELKTINQHRIFNKELGKFTYPMTDQTPVGTTTFNANGMEITLINKEVIYEKVEFFNVITDKHINLFADSILTSCRYNNIYPIENMKFLRDNRIQRSRQEFENISDEYFDGLRLAEQIFPIEDIEAYIDRLEYVRDHKSNPFQPKLTSPNNAYAVRELA